MVFNGTFCKNTGSLTLLRGQREENSSQFAIISNHIRSHTDLHQGQ